jgi:hypothetical protein
MSDENHPLTLPEDILANVIVIERKSTEKFARDIPAAPLPVSDFLDPIRDDEFARNGGIKRSIIFNVIGDHGQNKSSGNRFAEPQLQRSNPIIHNVIIDSVEEWTVFNWNINCQVIHLHINPMFVTKINETEIEPYWCEHARSAIWWKYRYNRHQLHSELRFNDFIGPSIIHSQMLVYADLGLVQAIHRSTGISKNIAES